jgi:hypothetical protein
MCTFLHYLFVGVGILFIIFVAMVYVSFQMKNDKEK